ncbi:DUF3467 domain-containing protein [Candidatus Woesearchaeota archaeon]|nr:DUF3467 domain-containing protein [Candidatus Woesearchaeota archaeon]
MEKKINLTINEGEAFFAHELSVNFNPLQFMLDFKCITPRIDPRMRESMQMHIKHNVIMLDPYHLKQILPMMQDSLQRYEKEFGKIEKPKSLKKMDKKQTKKEDGTIEAVPTYLG